MYPMAFVCPICKNEHSVKVNFTDWDRYLNGALAQNAFPSPLYTATERESIISGLCPDCQKKIFG